LSGVADAAQVELGILIGRWPSPQIHLIRLFVFVFLAADVILNRNRIPAYSLYEVAAHPEALPT
jgi:hypothetical protein